MKKKLREHGCFRSWVFIYRLWGGVRGTGISVWG